MLIKGKVLAVTGATLLISCFLAFGTAYQRRVEEGGMIRTSPITSAHTAVVHPSVSSPVTSDREPTVPAIPDSTSVPNTTDDFENIDIGGYGSAGTDTEEIPVSGTETEPTTTPVTKPQTTPALQTTPVPETTPATPEPTPIPPVTTFPEGQGGLYDIAAPDPDYDRRVVVVTGEDRKLLEALVEGEAGDQGFIGAAMVAQCIKDAMTFEGYESVAAVRKGLKYSGRIDREPCEDVVKAVAYIFDEGGYAVKHPMLYFYYSRNGIRPGVFHETQELVVEYKDHRYFWKKT